MKFTTRRLVQFADTDMAGIVHFTNYLTYMEEAEHAFLRERGLSVVMHDERGSYGFPKIAVQCNYRKPVRFEEWLDITLHAATHDFKSIEYSCTLHCNHELVAEGSLHVACCRFPRNALPYPIPLPDHVLRALGCEMVRGEPSWVAPNLPQL